MLLILASASAARQSLLRNAGLKFFAVPADLDEAAIKQTSTGNAESLALALAAAKAAMVAATCPEALVIGADQLLLCDGKIFDKPADAAEAAAHLRLLRGRTHKLITAVCVYRHKTLLWSNVASAHLTMRSLTEDFIEGYLAAEADAILGCVGAYRLEGLGAQLFTAVEGDFFTILGLNLLPLLGYLRESAALPD
jgi:septum formation protein